MARTKRPVIVDATVTEEYVVCSVCLTRNRVRGHATALRPLCGRCGYPLPDPFSSQPRRRSPWEWLRRHRALGIGLGVLFAAAFARVVTLYEDDSGPVSEFSPKPARAERSTELGPPRDAITIVIRPVTSTFFADQPDHRPAQLAAIRMESPSDDRPEEESVVIVVDLSANNDAVHSSSDSDDGSELSVVSVVSRLQKRADDDDTPTDMPSVVERIRLNNGKDFSD
ncbi:MAG TPA: hypothetical protein VMP11_17900 [Verrucomicrobiae bacterium]|nr:hypothetical protein [Verrucomicrobiae bacterium]